MEPSNEQLLAIKSHGTNVLVNAGAGSGKTWVLSQHVLYLMKKYNYKITDFLIVTFTIAAAYEMKDRIKKFISEDPLLSKNVSDVDFAQISTFDAFNLHLVKKYHKFLGIDEINIIEGSIIELQTNKYINEELNKYYESDNSVLFDFIELLCKKNDDIIFSIIKKIIAFCNRSLNKEEFLNNITNKNVILDLYHKFKDNEFSKIKILYDECKELTNKLSIYDSDVFSKYQQTFQSVKINNFDDFLSSIKNVQFPKITTKKQFKDDEYYRDIHYDLKSIYNEFKEIYKKFSFDLYEKELLNQNFIFTTFLVDIVKKVMLRLDEFKKEHSSYTFDDVAKFAIKILRNKAANEAIKKEYKYIMIDEYQDTSDIQEEIIKLLENNNTFLVGDVKQSIYRFRNANCMIFLNKYNRYKQNDGGVKIDMTLNFRSRKEIIDSINVLFDDLMQHDSNIDYKDGHYSFYGQFSYDNKKSGYKYGIQSLIYDYDSKQTDRYDKEIRIIASDIKKKIADKMQIYDLKLEKFRDVQFKDFAILVDRGSNVSVIESILDEYKLPYFKNMDENILNNDIYAIIKNLFVLFYQGSQNNFLSMSYKHAFVSIARSYLFSYSDEKIYQLIKTNKYCDDNITKMIKDLTPQSNCLSLYETSCLLLEKFKVLDKLISIGNFHQVHSTINLVLSKLQTLDSLFYRLEDLLTFFDDLKQENIEMKGTEIKLDDNVINLTNYHKSKGLEYTICYYPFLFSNFNRYDINSKLVFSKDFGLVSKNYLYNKESSILLNAFKEKARQEDFEEKLRLLYVALTRAKEMAILILGNPNLDNIKDAKEETNFSDILKHVYNKLEKQYISDDFIENIDLLDKQKETEKQFTLLNPIKIDSKKINVARASKSLITPIDENVLLLGDKLHHIMQKVDFLTKDTSFVKDAKLKNIIDRVLKDDLFLDIDDATILKEFPFNDKLNHINGIIDCLIIKKDYVYIIDYKSKNIDDVAYDKQLNNYAKYIRQLTNKDIKLYLLSLIDNVKKEVMIEWN